MPNCWGNLRHSFTGRRYDSKPKTEKCVMVKCKETTLTESTKTKYDPISVMDENWYAICLLC